ncbi:hypothetical protein ASE90_17675 [Sphingomonas sp. Leaf67]|uniref:hypothetical protein n=1 Tax=unclassified Sphingomonas TaxID=196159 RepID=UPI0006F26893|nr:MULTISPECIES: hypothetical protein [unclassified Sphingomonas]KQN74551.1 hypothetical protein ASE91_02065 [Sphingomonas sp. Leaf62]KQN90405.1 hypothetical protein ASE90_17675 [Sphingomonas sp. Leaf67]
MNNIARFWFRQLFQFGAILERLIARLSTVKGASLSRQNNGNGQRGRADLVTNNGAGGANVYRCNKYFQKSDYGSAESGRVVFGQCAAACLATIWIEHLERGY